MSAGLLWSSGRGDKPSLRSRGDPSLGPAFGRRPGSGSMVVIDGNSTSREAEEGMDGDPRWGTGNGGREEDRSWAVSGRPLVYLCAVCSSLCSILLGYDVGVMSGAKEYIRPDLHLSEGRLVSFVYVCVCVCVSSVVWLQVARSSASLYFAFPHSA